jgi:hypothetical protein
MLRGQNDERLEKRIGKERLHDAADDTAGFISSGVKRQLTKNERLALTSQLLRCLNSYIKGVLGLPVTLKTVVDSVSLIHEATDRSFPGYAESKMLLYLIQPTQNSLVERDV